MLKQIQERQYQGLFDGRVEMTLIGFPLLGEHQVD